MQYAMRKKSSNGFWMILLSSCLFLLRGGSLKNTSTSTRALEVGHTGDIPSVSFSNLFSVVKRNRIADSIFSVVSSRNSIMQL